MELRSEVAVSKADATAVATAGWSSVDKRGEERGVERSGEETEESHGGRQTY